MDAIFLLPGVSLYSSCISNAGMAPSSATVGINMYIYTVKGLYTCISPNTTIGFDNFFVKL